MKATEPVLVGLPPVQPQESPSSWVTRAALSQGVPVKEFIEFLGIPDRRDFDKEFLGPSLPRVEALCGLPRHAFAIAAEVVRWVESAELGGTRLWESRRGLARSRLCPFCMGEQRTPYHRIHQRFRAWRYCPLHFCMLEDMCWYCKEPILLPRSLLEPKWPETECIYLSQCLRCGRFHHQGPVADGGLMLTHLRDDEALLLDRGCELVATMYRDICGMPDRNLLPQLPVLMEAARCRYGPTADLVRARAERDQP